MGVQSFPLLGKRECKMTCLLVKWLTDFDENWDGAAM